MQSGSWAPQHSQALREFFARGMSYSQIAEALNARFGTGYTRSAVIGRGRRLGLVAPVRRANRSKPVFKAQSRRKRPSAQRFDPKAPVSAQPALPPPPTPAEAESPPVRAEPVKLRCVGVRPRLVSLVELGPGDCRYPYGGDRDGEPIVFCGHPQQEGSSYCTPHFHLTRGPDAATERAAGPVLLRLVEAA